METLVQEFNRITDTWYGKATVRHTPRICVPHYSTADQIYPAERVIICDHPLVQARGLDTRSYILTQTAYQFLFGIANVETRFVINCALDIVHKHSEGINVYDKLQALTILIDEGYHAQVALDYVTQVRNQSGIAPLKEPDSNRMIDATQRVYKKIPEELKTDFQLLAITLAENILTEEIAKVSRDTELEETFVRVMREHVSDEGRHAHYFVNLMKKRWRFLPRETQLLFGRLLPDYLDDFVGADTSRAFERELLTACNFSIEDIDCIIFDTNPRYLAGYNTFSDKTKGKLYRLLKHIGVFELEENLWAFDGRSYT